MSELSCTFSKGSNVCPPLSTAAKRMGSEFLGKRSRMVDELYPAFWEEELRPAGRFLRTASVFNPVLQDDDDLELGDLSAADYFAKQKRIGSEFLGKRSEHKRMGSEFLGRRRRNAAA